MRSPVPLAASLREGGTSALAEPTVDAGSAAADSGALDAVGGGAKAALAVASCGALGSTHRLIFSSKYIVLSSPSVAFFPLAANAELIADQPQPDSFASTSSLLIKKEQPMLSPHRKMGELYAPVTRQAAQQRVFSRLGPA